MKINFLFSEFWKLIVKKLFWRFLKKISLESNNFSLTDLSPSQLWFSCSPLLPSPSRHIIVIYLRSVPRSFPNAIECVLCTLRDHHSRGVQSTLVVEATIFCLSITADLWSYSNQTKPKKWRQRTFFFFFSFCSFSDLSFGGFSLLLLFVIIRLHRGLWRFVSTIFFLSKKNFIGVIFKRTVQRLNEVRAHWHTPPKTDEERKDANQNDKKEPRSQPNQQEKVQRKPNKKYPQT